MSTTSNAFLRRSTCFVTPLEKKLTGSSSSSMLLFEQFGWFSSGFHHGAASAARTVSHCRQLFLYCSSFDMIPGIDVKWWGADGDDVDSFLSGKVISNDKLSGSYWNDSLQSLRLLSMARKNRTSGEIINYMAVDVEQVIDFLWWTHDIWVVPLQVILALAILYMNVGSDAALAALVATIATVLANIPLTTLQGTFQEQLMAGRHKSFECMG